MDTNSKNLKKTHPYNCESCNFSTVNKKDFSRHLATDKHKILTNPNLKVPKNPYVYCTCGKSYKHSSSLCAHKKKCNLKINNNVNASQVILQPTETKDTPSDKELIMMLVQENAKLSKDNHDFKEMMLELMKNGTHNVHTNSHNKTFNLQFFLNETCKDGESRTNNQYLHIVSESMGCCEPANYGKIIHNVSKQVIVDK